MRAMYAPGIFSRNLAWGTGQRLTKLPSAIRRGFQNDLAPVNIETWRERSGIANKSLNLIPPRFYLHNCGNDIVVDELAYRALHLPYDDSFERLVLFALNLSHIGQPSSDVTPRPALWANEFVRNELWERGKWRRSKFSQATMDAFIQARLNADRKVAEKCRMNYRRIYELLGYIDAPQDEINTRPEHWAAAALFLTWDRTTFRWKSMTPPRLVRIVQREEVWKLIGTDRAWLRERWNRIAADYIEAGGFRRFANRGYAPVIADERHVDPFDILDQIETDSETERRIRSASLIVRNQRLAAALKQAYDNTCSFCGTRLCIGGRKFYSEAAHVRQLGSPGYGPDRKTNMIVLCPNHHIQFDSGAIRLKRSGNGYRVVCSDENDELHGRFLKLKHDLDPGHVAWHFEFYSL